VANLEGGNGSSAFRFLGGKAVLGGEIINWWKNSKGTEKEVEEEEEQRERGNP
jgi:hypothetical protein